MESYSLARIMLGFTIISCELIRGILRNTIEFSIMNQRRYHGEIVGRSL